MYTHHYLIPEKCWGVFCNGAFVAKFDTAGEARQYCIRHLATENQNEYAETNYPMPRIVNTPSRNRKLCKKCSEKNNQ